MTPIEAAARDCQELCENFYRPHRCDYAPPREIFIAILSKHFPADLQAEAGRLAAASVSDAELERGELVDVLARLRALNAALDADFRGMKRRFCEHHGTPGALPLSPPCPACERDRLLAIGEKMAAFCERVRKDTEVGLSGEALQLVNEFKAARKAK